MITRISFLFLLLITSLVSGDRRDTTVRFRLRRFGDDHERMTVLAKAGHPERELPLTLTFTVPSAFHSEALWSESATQGDLPGLYAAIYVFADDRALQRELGVSSYVSDDLLSAPTLRLESLGEEHFWIANTTRDPVGQLGVAPSSKSRGFFMLGPGSAVWLKARYAQIERQELILTNTLKKQQLQHRITLACAARDEKGRCVLAPEGYTVRTHTRSGVVTNLASAGRLILDLDAYATILPGTLAGSLRRAVRHPNDAEAVHWIEWIVPSSSSQPLLLARAKELQSSVLQQDETAGAAFVSVAGGHGTDLILGRELLTRLFSELTYDSSDAVWYALAADTSETYSETVRWVMTILLIAQAFLVARHLLNPHELSLTHVLKINLKLARASSNKKNKHLYVLPVYYSMAVVVVAALQVILGLVYLGTGSGVDPQRAAALLIFAHWNLGIASGFAALLLLSWVLLYLYEPTYSLEYLIGTAYVTLGICGLMACLLPRAAQGLLELALLCALVFLLLFLLSYHFFGTLVVLIVRLHLPMAPRSVTLYRWLNGTWFLALVTSCAGFVLLAYVAGTDVVVETVRAFNTQQSDAKNTIYSIAALMIMFIIGGFLSGSELRDCFYCYMARWSQKQAGKTE